MSIEASEQSQQEKGGFATNLVDVDQWFSTYFQTFIDIGAGLKDPSEILTYWGVPLHSSSPKHSKWLKSAKEVMDFLQDMQKGLKEVGYTHTVAIDKMITMYSENAGRVETIMSRRGKDDLEVDRAAISFELRRGGKEWIIISTTAQPTKLTKLQDVWLEF
ncbi:DUF6841 family protein [Dyadobacter frigoris]|uniref:DUF6841 domain-containing protein n=1 Tax=Dyadobacter frigoris TaxID=2576211 RepID=A0A4U6D7F8_9BACT|nr:hypothetical protein [Dyadobacter frigoris]TKT93369.1 hypothetical protein FDK13_05830 [Dyadobacter frigoris]GLU54682.1 hypothetical protein Dfri01_41430 [Dyadobacter frigoris]